MAYAAAGDFDDAVICAGKALDLTPPEKKSDVAGIQARLELYQKHQPWLESFGRTNAPAIPPFNK